jgi:hypothetical protein
MRLPASITALLAAKRPQPDAVRRNHREIAETIVAVGDRFHDGQCQLAAEALPVQSAFEITSRGGAPDRAVQRRSYHAARVP